MKKKTKLGSEMVAGLEEFLDCLRNGDPIESRFQVDVVALIERDMIVVQDACARGEAHNITAIRISTKF